MAETGDATVVMTGLVGEPGDKIVRDPDGTLRLIKAADMKREPRDGEPCEPDDEG